ncbi:50S ribosomal protein L6 [Candidatus Woesearchaeota archaeon]|nr:50S ribosomal protein L6 [Candidatus Woesearchaeota archaeon]
MKINDYVEELNLSDGVSVSVDKRLVKVTGPKGEVQRALFSPGIMIEPSGNNVTIKVRKYTMREKKLVGTFRAHIKNMAKGVTEGCVYKLKICSGHFPMNISFGNGVLTIKNFIGEKIPRTITIDPKVTLKLDGDIITLESVDKELVGQTAANIEKKTKRPNFDRRIFQDGIYITEKDGKEIK